MSPKKWRKRTHGTSAQIGKAFPIDDESMQSKKASLPRLSESSEDRQRRIRRQMAQHYADMEEEAEREAEEEREAKKEKSLLHRVAKAVKPKDKPTTEKKMVGGLPARVPIEEEQTPVEELRIEVKPVIEVAKDYGSDVKEWFKTTRVFLYLQRKADERVSKKEQQKNKDETSH